MKNFTSENTSSKVNWQGKFVSIQPRTRVWRYLTDNRTHYHLGYNFFIEGLSSDAKKQFIVTISEKQQIKGLFRIGDELEGTAWTKRYEVREFADYYKAGSLKLLNRANENFDVLPPPWLMMPPSIQIYEEKGARILSKSLWETKCFNPFIDNKIAGIMGLDSFVLIYSYCLKVPFTLSDFK